MAAAKKQKGQGPKIKKKIWLPIYAPKFFNETELGQTHVIEPSQALGKHVTANLMTLTRDIKKQNINISFEINNVSGDKATTKPVKFKIIPSAIKRMVRRRRDRVDESFQTTTKDGVKIRIKPMIITRANTAKSVQTAMRIRAASHIIRLAGEKTYEQLFELIIQYKLQRELKNKLSKVYPVRACEIREVFIESEKKAKKSKERFAVDEPEPVKEEEYEDEPEAKEEEKEKAEESESTEEPKDEKKSE